MLDKFWAFFDGSLLTKVIVVLMIYAVLYFGGMTAYGLMFKEQRAAQVEAYRKLEQLRFDQYRKRLIHNDSFSAWLSHGQKASFDKGKAKGDERR